MARLTFGVPRKHYIYILLNDNTLIYIISFYFLLKIIDDCTAKRVGKFRNGPLRYEGNDLKLANSTERTFFGRLKLKMNIDHLKLFVRLAATQNISSAGREIGLSAAVASSYLSKLEAGLGVRLVHRTTRKVSLTEEGIHFLPHAEEILSTIEAAKTSVGVGNSSPSGILKVTAPASFGRLHLLPAIHDFLGRYENLTLDLRLSDTIVDLVEGGFDIAIRSAGPQDSNFVARQMAPDRRVLCASPDYVATYGRPASPEELQNHQCITLIGLDSWAFASPSGHKTIKTAGRFRTDNGEAMRDACMAGLGIALNSTWSVFEQLERGELIEILPDHPLVYNTAIWAVYPSSRLLAPKVRLFIDFFAERFGEPPYWDQSWRRHQQ